jgi:hypothetical protein
MRSWKRGVTRAWASGLLLCVAVVAALEVTEAGATTPAPSCRTIAIRALNNTLGIASVAVNRHAGSIAGSFICSYYGASGGYKNQASIIFLPAGPVQFAGIKAGLSKQHTVVTVPGLLSGAYYYHLAPNYYLYVLDGTYQVQMFAAVPIAKLELLARRLPIF